jgi:hypothetical protein
VAKDETRIVRFAVITTNEGFSISQNVETSPVNSINTKEREGRVKGGDSFHQSFFKGGRGRGNISQLVVSLSHRTASGRTRRT